MAINDKRIDQLIPSTIPLAGTDLFAIYNANGTRNDSLDSITDYVGQNIVVTGITTNDTYVTGGTLNSTTLELGRNQGLTTLSVDLSSLSGDTNTASNVGGGNNVFDQKVGTDLQFRTLVAGTNVTITSGATTLTINSSGGGGGGATTQGFFLENATASEIISVDTLSGGNLIDAISVTGKYNYYAIGKLLFVSYEFLIGLDAEIGSPTTVRVVSKIIPTPGNLSSTVNSAIIYGTGTIEGVDASAGYTSTGVGVATILSTGGSNIIWSVRGSQLGALTDNLLVKAQMMFKLN